MFIFNNTEDLDIASYNYQLYDEDQIDQSTPGIYQPIENAVVLSSGSNNASVFTVNVNGSYIDENGQEQKKHYFGRVRTLNTSGVYGDWTAIVRTDTETDLLDEQYIVSLTADRIKAGIIESAEIILGGAKPEETLIKSSTYNGTYNTLTEKWETGTTGWLISGNGQAIFDATQIRGSVSAGSINLNDHNYWLPADLTATSPRPFTTFKVGTASQYLYFNGNNGTFSGALNGGTIQIGSGESVFKADSNGIYLGNETFANAEFRVTPAGALTATNANITGVVTATSGSIAGINMSGGILYTGVGNWSNSNTGFYLDQNGYFSLKDRFVWNPATNVATFRGALDSASGSVGADFTIGNNLVIGNNVRINGAAGDGARSVLKVRADDQPNNNTTNPGRQPLTVVSFLDNVAFRVLYTGDCRYGASMQLESDIRLKKDIEKETLGLDFIKDLNPVSFYWNKTEFSSNKKYRGFIAQEIIEVSKKFNNNFEGIFLEDENDPESFLGLDYPQFISPMVKAIQELSAKVDELESRLV